MSGPGQVALLCGGFGGARFAPGLVAAAGAESTTIVTNPGDDLRYMSLEVWPDFDSVLYALAGTFDEVRGWGPRDDTTKCVDALGDEGWFSLGDRDMALSLRRTGWLQDGAGRAEAARRCREALQVDARLVPASAQPHTTRVGTDAGEVGLQEYLVRLRAADPPRTVRISPAARGAPDEALRGLDAELVLLGPSNPVLSLMPIVSVPGVAERLRAAERVVAVSPVVSGVAPRTAPEAGRYRVRETVMEMVGLPHTAGGAAEFWKGLIDAMVVDARDAHEAVRIQETLGIPTMTTDLLPPTEAARRALAAEVLEFGRGLPAAGRPRRIAGGIARFLPGA